MHLEFILVPRFLKSCLLEKYCTRGCSDFRYLKPNRCVSKQRQIFISIKSHIMREFCGNRMDKRRFVFFCSLKMAIFSKDIRNSTEMFPNEQIFQLYIEMCYYCAWVTVVHNKQFGVQISVRCLPLPSSSKKEILCAPSYGIVLFHFFSVIGFMTCGFHLSLQLKMPSYLPL